MNNLKPVEIDGKTGEVHELPPQRGKRYRAKLDTLSDVKREMARVYRESRSGILEPTDGTKFVWMLEKIGKAIESGDLEARIEKLEQAQR